ncbi:MAG: hypothetical protein CMD25_04205 [Flavobacteriales bacterium]|nr:hypothetical protein [Flavobacteriales bacterium]
MSFNAPDIRQFKLTGSTVGDVHFPKVKLLLPFNGSNGATSTTDSSNSNNSVTFVGTAQISTAQSKFGGSSMLFDGDSDYLTVTNSSFSTFNASGATFTIEFWVYFNSISGQQDFVMNYASSSGGLIIRKTSGHVIQTNLSGDGADITGTTTVSTGQWYHVALSGSSGSYKLFLNGTQEGSTYTGALGAGSSTYQIGAFYWSSTLYNPLNGYLDDMRFTAGLARYTSNFTPPTSAHSTSAGDANKQIIVNSDADGVDVGTGGINQARIAKAWVNFEGTDTSNIRGSYNVSSISDRGTGLFTVNFSTAMTDANYAVNATSGHGSDTATTATARTGGTISTTACHISTGYRSSSSVLADMNYNAVTFFGN